jgi:hypothetical protein
MYVEVLSLLRASVEFCSMLKFSADGVDELETPTLIFGDVAVVSGVVGRSALSLLSATPRDSLWFFSASVVRLLFGAMLILLKNKNKWC